MTASDFTVNPENPPLVTNTVAISNPFVVPATLSLATAPESATFTIGKGVFTGGSTSTTNQNRIVLTDPGTLHRNVSYSFPVMPPTTINPAIQSVSFPSGTPTLTINGITGPDYIILVSTNLVDWQAAGTNISPATLPFSWTDPTPSAPAKFYRVLLKQ
jgi:hypothetical protein